MTGFGLVLRDSSGECHGDSRSHGPFRLFELRIYMEDNDLCGNFGQPPEPNETHSFNFRF